MGAIITIHQGMYCLYSHLSSMIPPQQIHIYSNSNINSASFQKVKIVRQ